MRLAALLAVTLLAACGQTGSLYLPDESVETPVEIRTTPAPVPEPDEDENDPKDAPPPSG
ncbi:MAG: lipoprotein [Steroidobacteraceae bacterium]